MFDRTPGSLRAPHKDAATPSAPGCSEYSQNNHNGTTTTQQIVFWSTHVSQALYLRHKLCSDDHAASHRQDNGSIHCTVTTRWQTLSCQCHRSQYNACVNTHGVAHFFRVQPGRHAQRVCTLAHMLHTNWPTCCMHTASCAPDIPWCGRA